MGTYLANLPTMTIDLGFASSSVLTGFEDASALVIMGPTTLTALATVRIATESDGVTASATWADYVSGGTTVTIATGGKTVQFTPPVAGSLMLVTAATESGRRYFQVQKKFAVGGA